MRSCDEPPLARHERHAPRRHHRIGLVTPLGCGVDATWSRLIAGRSGAGPITKFKVDDLPCRIACDVPRGDGADGTFNPDQWVDPEGTAPRR